MRGFLETMNDLQKHGTCSGIYYFPVQFLGLYVYLGEDLFQSFIISINIHLASLSS